MSKVNFIRKFASNSALINCGTIKSPFYICYYNAFIRSRQREVYFQSLLWVEVK
ncbi:hypothetical protein LCGT_1360 [Lactococcus garvieae ATCC 49156]|uniref:Uncharacterized protein n=1 Tax=Lactococcus garvieae (strain Lg2) TaxID=420890 RepID=F9VEU0_LACGL|nr:hypothetical protein LCGT_1360 [Lactococcus garvieae ATCC 49156]BAK60841.1 hypothetical protein LCGL_1381 [Lactococcus garvieae Lg2]